MSSNRQSCTEYYYANEFTKTNQERNCTGLLKDSWTSGKGCPQDASVIGTCDVKDRIGRFKKFVYKTDAGSPFEPKEGCAILVGSEWRDGPAAATVAVPAPTASSKKKKK